MRIVLSYIVNSKNILRTFNIVSGGLLVVKLEKIKSKKGITLINISICIILTLLISKPTINKIFLIIKIIKT